MNLLDEEIEDARAFAMRHPLKWWRRPVSHYTPEWVIPAISLIVVVVMFGVVIGVASAVPSIIRDWDERRDCDPIVIGVEP